MTAKNNSIIKSEQDTPESDDVTKPTAAPAPEEVEEPAKPAPAEAPETEGGEDEATPAGEPAKPAAAASALNAVKGGAIIQHESVIQIGAEEYEKLKAQAAASVSAQQALLTTQAKERAGELMRAGQADPAKRLNVQSVLELLMAEDAENAAKVAISFDTDGKPTAHGSRVEAFIAALPDPGTMAAGTMVDEAIPTYALPSARVEEGTGKTAEELQAEAKAEVAAYSNAQGKK